MAIDLFIDAADPIAVKPLLTDIRAVLVELLGISAIPALRLERLEHGEQRSVEDDRIGDDDGASLLLSLIGEPETVALGGRRGYLAVTISGSRTALQCALGAAAVIVLARQAGGGVSDDWRLFGDEVHTTPQALLERLRVTTSHTDYRGAAEAIRWGPGAR